MPGEAAQSGMGKPGLRSLAEKVRWLIETAHPADRGPYSIAEVCFLIHKATGEQVSHTTIWKLANGQSQNPSKRLIELLARTFGVPPAFFFDDYDGLMAYDKHELHQQFVKKHLQHIEVEKLLVYDFENQAK